MVGIITLLFLILDGGDGVRMIFVFIDIVFKFFFFWGKEGNFLSVFYRFF